MIIICELGVVEFSEAFGPGPGAFGAGPAKFGAGAAQKHGKM